MRATTQAPVEQIFGGIDNVINEEQSKRLIAHVRSGFEDGVTKALRVALTNVVNVGEVGGTSDALQAHLVTLFFELYFKLKIAIEVILQRILVASGDHEYVGEPSIHGFFNHVLNDGLVYNRQHLFGKCLRRRKKPRSQTGNGNNGFERMGCGHEAILPAQRFLG